MELTPLILDVALSAPTTAAATATATTATVANAPIPVSAWIFCALLLVVGVGRLLEMRLSRSHQRALRTRGAVVRRESIFPVMVMLHTGVLIAAAVEAIVARRPLIPALAIIAGLLFVAANLLRVVVIRTMALHWNVQVVDSGALGIVSHGPFRYVRHPNYVAVFIELLALPLIHSAWLTALCGTALHLLVLSRRIALEESVLMANPDYRQRMGDKPRFIPRATWPTS